MLKEAVELWNEYAKRCGWPQIRGLSDERERKLTKILRDRGINEWEEALNKAEASDFLMGRSERNEEHQNWRLTFDTFVRGTFFLRVLEGNYDNRSAGYSSGSLRDPDAVMWRARLKNYKPGAFWMSMWGPRPEEQSCQAPAPLLAEWKSRHVN